MAEDSSFLVEPSFRFQTNYTGRFYLDSEMWEERLMIRRLRLKFDGFAFSPKVVYKFELGFASSDTRLGRFDEGGNTSSIVLDAVIKWGFAPGWVLWFGQTKLPGNRERVISSQNLQFVDRSLVNANFNLDRDIGLQLHHTSRVGETLFKQSFAVSAGEGRNMVVTNAFSGRQYTARFEIFPFGDFKAKGAYFGADLAREPSPKLAVGVTGDYNSNAVRARGNLGPFLTDAAKDYVSSDLYTLFIDGIFKYQGWSAAFEYAYRDSENKVAGFGYGEGVTASSGYLFPNDMELAVRFTSVEPLSGMSTVEGTDEYMIGFSRYVKGHNLKIQSDFSYSMMDEDEFFMFRLQTEIAL